MDMRLYLCSKCCRRCLWDELSDQEHRCQRCRLPDKDCIICNRRFEPREHNEQHCNRCAFHMKRYSKPYL
ncbi:protein FAM76B [Drosophila busckii]|nr:protein FAM76B [Drosophila busckii]